jgi:glycosyltransferase involved in cell wall biosynthesis
MTPLITVIIPTFRRPNLLKRALNSAVSQTFSEIEIHVYDNASNDGTEEVVEGFMQKDRRVHYHCHKENLGMIGNYQFSLAQVKTPYFCFLSDDDLLFPWYCEEAMKGFQQFPECGLSAASTIIMTEKGKVMAAPLHLWSTAGYFPAPEGVLEMIGKYPIPTCILFHRKVLEEVFIDSNNALMWDCDFLLQIAARFPIFVSKRPSGIFLHHDSSFSGHQDLENWDNSMKLIAKRLESLTHLSSKSKGQAIALLKLESQQRNQAFILLSFANKKFHSALLYAKAFRKKYGLSLKSLIFLNLTRICFWLPIIIYPIFLIRKLKQLMKKRSYSQYIMYAKWLKE